ncbi:MAG: hypothetical protein P0S95_04120 [Rhabdochlamydiaceae bacterium]|nr:hypothetical protein [Candidatus Amphrikana amoebophyrae]
MKPIFFLFLLFNLSSLYANEKLPARLNSRYGVLINSDSGATIIEKNHTKKIFPASTSKIATALFALHKLKGRDINQLVTVTPHCIKKVTPEYKYSHIDQLPPYILQTDGTSFGLLPDEEVSYLSLLYGLLLISGNDAANTLAYHLGGHSIERFMNEMNEFFVEIGCYHTHFVNPHGLQHPKQVSTPMDMAIIAKEALKYPLIRKIVASPEYEKPKSNKQKGYTIYQSNKLLIEGKLHFDEALGMKTGFTTLGGYCLIACASNNKRNLVATLFNSKERNFRYHDAIEMFNIAFDEKPFSHKLFNANSLPFKRQIDNGKYTLKARLLNDVSIEYYKSENPTIKSELIFDTLSLPIIKGEKVGSLIVFVNDVKVKEVDLFAVNSIKLKWFQLPALKWSILFLVILLTSLKVYRGRKLGQV